MKKGFLNIILHAHLPYVRHPEYKSFFEENWLFEAMTESYIPLIQVLDSLERDKVKFRLTLSLSPTLISMLRDDLLQARYAHYLNKQIELAEKEVVRTRQQPQYQKLARLYRRLFINTKKTYQQYQSNLLTAFKKHHEAGRIELITTAATHGFLPVLNISETAVQQQINIGINTFKSNFGFSPAGFWLPECGFYPGLEKHLSKAEIKYFFTDTHGLLDANIELDNNVYAPVDCGNSVLAFARDPESSQQVWNAEQGYPANVNYREYYSDIGFELEQIYLAPYILDGKKRVNTGIKYHRVTGDSSEKECYEPRQAKHQIEQDAIEFVKQCQLQIEQLGDTMDRLPIITAPYDAELFGHWWFEGPAWLETVIRLVSEDSIIETATCSDYLKQQTSHQVSMPAASTWGEGGYSSYWVNEENDWIYPFLHQAVEQMERLTADFRIVTVLPIQERALNQALRSLLLAQASDWPFIMKTGTTSEYAKKRLTDCLARFNYLHECIRKNRIDEHYLLALETMDNLFPEIDFRDYRAEVL